MIFEGAFIRSGEILRRADELEQAFATPVYVMKSKMICGINLVLAVELCSTNTIWDLPTGTDAISID